MQGDGFNAKEVTGRDSDWLGCYIGFYKDSIRVFYKDSIRRNRQVARCLQGLVERLFKVGGLGLSMDWQVNGLLRAS